MSSTLAPNFSAPPAQQRDALFLRRLRETVVCGGLLLVLGLGGVGVEVTGAQSPEQPPPDNPAVGSVSGPTSSHTAIVGSAIASPESVGDPVLEVERTDTIEAERPPAPPDLPPAEPASALVPANPSSAPQLSRERVILEADPRTPGQRSSLLLSAQAEVKVAPAWARAESGVSFSDGTLVVRSRRFSSTEEACQELTNLAVTWLRQKYEFETGRTIADPVGILRQEADLEVVLQSYVQDIELSEQKVLETPMYIGHLRLPETDTLRERVYADWRSQLVKLRLYELVGMAALCSAICAVVGRFLRTLPESR